MMLPLKFRKILLSSALFGLLSFISLPVAHSQTTERSRGTAILPVHVAGTDVAVVDAINFRGQAAAEVEKPSFGERFRRTISNIFGDDDAGHDRQPTAATNVQAPVTPSSIPTQPPPPIRITSGRSAATSNTAGNQSASRGSANSAATVTTRTATSSPTAETTTRVTSIRSSEQNSDAADQDDEFHNRLQGLRQTFFDKMPQTAPRSAVSDSAPRVASRGDSDNVPPRDHAESAPRATTAPSPSPSVVATSPTPPPNSTQSQQNQAQTLETRPIATGPTANPQPRTPSRTVVTDAVPNPTPATTAQNSQNAERVVRQQHSSTPSAGSTMARPEALSSNSEAFGLANNQPSNMPRSTIPRRRSVLVGPQIDVETECDSQILLGQETQYRIRAINRGNAPAENVVLRIDIPRWIDIAPPDATLGRVTIHPRENDESQYELVWMVGAMRGQAEEQLVLRLVPKERKSIDLQVHYEFDHPSTVDTVAVQEVVLEMELDGPEEVLWGTQVSYRLLIRNVGNGPAENIRLELLQTGTEAQVCELPLLRAGEERSEVVDVWTGKQSQIDINIQAQADYNLSAQVKKSITVLKPDIIMTVESPAAQFLGKDAEYVVKLQNLGTAEAKNLVLVADVPLGATLVSCSQNGALSPDKQVVWKIPSLPIGEIFVCNLVCQSNREGDCLLTTAVSDRSGLLAECQGSFQAVAIIDLKLDVATPDGPVEVGDEAIYTVTVENRGTKIAENVEVTVSFGRGLEPFAAEGGKVLMKDGQVVFDAIPRLAAGQQVVLKVKGKADSPGSHRIRTDIVCPSADTHLVNEQTSYFFQNQRSKNTVATSQETVAAMPGAMLPGATLETAPTALHITAQPAELPKQDAVLDNNALQTATTLDPFSVQ